MVRALPKTTTKVYLLNPDYLFGQSVQRDTRKWLGRALFAMSGYATAAAAATFRRTIKSIGR